MLLCRVKFTLGASFLCKSAGAAAVERLQRLRDISTVNLKLSEIEVTWSVSLVKFSFLRSLRVSISFLFFFSTEKKECQNVDKFPFDRVRGEVECRLQGFKV